MLDPACGSGNFLYLALQALKDLEHLVQIDAEVLGFQRVFPEIGPANVKGIEINPYAAALARVSIWIGEIQWMRRNGSLEARDPILERLDTIEGRDAILTPDGTEPDWPEVDVVIGNPPFLGEKRQLARLGPYYMSRVRKTYAGRVPASSDLVCYWFEKAGRHIASGKATRAGLVATNSIRGGANRRALQAATEAHQIFEAWSDEPWVIDGTAVRVSLVCFAHADDQSVSGARLDGEPVDEIHTDLTARHGSSGVDLTNVRRLPENAGVAFMGDTKGGPFDVAGDQAREWLRLPENPNGRTNTDVLKPWVNGMDLTRRPAGKWIVDFGLKMSVSDAALYEEPFRWVKEHVWPASGAAPGPSATSASGDPPVARLRMPPPATPRARARDGPASARPPPAAAAVGALGPPQVREAGFAIGGRVRCGDGRPLTDRGRRRRQPRRLFADLTVPVGFVRRALHRPYTSTNRMHWCPSFTNSLSLATPRTHRSAHSRRTLRASSSRSASTLAKTSDGRFDHRSSRRSSSGLRPLCFLALQAFRRRGSIGFYETEFQCFPSSPPPTEPT